MRITPPTIPPDADLIVDADLPTMTAQLLDRDIKALLLRFQYVLDKDGIADVSHITMQVSYETKKGRSRGMLIEGGRNFLCSAQSMSRSSIT